MRVLLVDSHPGTAENAELALRSAGHDVVRCRDPKTPAAPCTAYSGECPLDTGRVDVAIDVRAVALASPTPGEQGVICASRMDVPVVVAGELAFHPFGVLDTYDHPGRDDLDGAVAAAVVAAAAAENARIGGAASTAAGQVVEAEREGAELLLTVRGAPEHRAAAAAVRAHAGARAADPTARRIRVRTDPPH